ncbi:hypothetical protein ATZ36_08495 [Candidatus Endomicrobiellum trichonymphae]|uniref:Uncharacterized protein n=1 Tax=Endomicrobium trichonymphae TaxID=1408204 RepID=A0A1E5IGH5_ENDTX|nr:hypothetical protein ATZ36_08495 [Candidatus Endomicrobium trichonymphae]
MLFYDTFYWGIQFREIMRGIAEHHRFRIQMELYRKKNLTGIHRGWIEQEEKELLVESMIKFL